MTTTEQETLERLRARLYPGRQEKAREGKTLTKVKPGDPADFLAAHPGAKLAKGKPMTCVRCGRQFQDGEFRALYQVGWLCRFCYKLLALAPVGARCIHCKEVISIDDWRYKLHGVTLDADGELKPWYVHQNCEKTMEKLARAA